MQAALLEEESNGELKKTHYRSKPNPKGPKNSQTGKKFSAFKTAEKYYKFYKNKTTDFSNLIDVTLPPEQSNIPPETQKFTIQHPTTKKPLNCFKFASPAGLTLIKSYIPKKDQVLITQRAINTYINKPHRTNLYIYSDPVKKLTSKAYNKEHFIVSDPQKYHFNTKIRWSNLGKQYDWDNRGYLSLESPMPAELSEMALGVVKMLEMGDYNPEALIVNYYHWRNFMGGHLDDGEPDQEHAILSFCFGLSCVFLIGGRTKEEEPIAIRLDSGDVLVMGKEARLCYHGVPRIIEGSFDVDGYRGCFGEEELPGLGDGGGVSEFGLPMNTVENVLRYMGESRVNMNFRQVVLVEEENIDGQGKEKGEEDENSA